jgi:DNA-binding NarL/FixJ family response regulator
MSGGAVGAGGDLESGGGLGGRAHEILEAGRLGLTNPEIAGGLVLSPYKVQDQIKSLFEKTRVSSLQELVARIFLDGYLPHLARRTPLTSGRGFA